MNKLTYWLLLKQMARMFIRACLIIYKRCISPYLPMACRFYPSCGDYAEQAIALHGLRQGGWLIMRRLGRCHPFEMLGGCDGIDFVPIPPYCNDVKK